MKLRKMLAVFIGVFCTLALSACGGEKKEDTTTASVKKELPKVVTTIFAPYDFARQIAGDKMEISMLLKPGMESHSYEPTPQDIIQIENCDVFVYVGGENDEWVEDILDSIKNPSMKTVKLLDCVENRVEEELVEGMEEEEEEAEGEAEGEEEAEWDEHVWTNPMNALRISEKMEAVFEEVDAENAALYKKNLESYTNTLTELDGKFRELFSEKKRDVLIFGDRFPLRYFVEAYGLRYYAAFPGCSGETEASAATIAFLTDKVKEEKIPVVFQIELSNGNIAKSIADAAGVETETFYACHNVSQEDFDAGVTYVSLMERNLEVLKKAMY